MKSLVWVNFFRQKVWLWPKTNSYLVGGAEKMALPPLNYDQKVEFWPFMAFLACCVQHCSHSRASALVQLTLLKSSDLFCGWFDTEVPMGSWRGDTRTPVVIMAKYIRTQPPIHLIRPKKFFSSLSTTPNSFIWHKGHFRPIYLEEITKLEPVLIYSSQFWYISMAVWWSILVNHVFIEDNAFGRFPSTSFVPLILPEHQFRVPNI